MSITMQEIAERLNLSQMTVSKVLRNQGRISDMTRQRVLEMATCLGYVPNRLASRLRAKKTGVIGLVVPDVIMNCNELVQHFFRVGHERNYDVEIALTEFDAEMENRAIHNMLAMQVDGIFLKSKHGDLAEVSNDGVLRSLNRPGATPVVYYGHSPLKNAEFIHHCHRPIDQQVRLLLDHLLAQGHRRLAWLFPVQEPLLNIYEVQVAQTLERLRMCGESSSVEVVTLTEDMCERGKVFYGNYIDEEAPQAGLQRGRELFIRAMRLEPRPTALLCFSDVTAIGAICQAQDMGLNIPEELAISAVSRTIATELSPMTLTHTCIDYRDLAGQVLTGLEQIEVCPTPKFAPIYTQPSLTVGQSTTQGAAGGVSKHKMSPAFTLIELLVVVAIISLLVSILLPSLSKAKDLAKSTVCQSQLRNHGQTAMMFTTENDGYLPRADIDGDPVLDGGDWLKQLLRYRELSANISSDIWTDPFHRCPAGPKNPTGSSCIQYGMNKALDPPYYIDSGIRRPTVPGIAITAIRRPATCVFFGDRRLDDWGPIIVGDNDSASNQVKYNPDLRHQNQAVLTFIDGHAGLFNEENSIRGEWYEYD